MSNKKRLIIGIALVILIGLLLACFLPYTRKIDVSLQGIECRIGNAEYVENRTITISGSYNKYLIKGDTFEGNIKIPGYDFTLKMPTSLLSFEYGHSLLLYTDMQNGIPVMEILGYIFCTPDFSKVLICVHEPTGADTAQWNSDNGLFICASAIDREGAVEIARELAKGSAWLSQSDINWE